MRKNIDRIIDGKWISQVIYSYCPLCELSAIEATNGSKLVLGFD